MVRVVMMVRVVGVVRIVEVVRMVVGVVMMVTLLAVHYFVQSSVGRWWFGCVMMVFSSFMDLRSQQEQQQQLHESLANRLTYRCKPVKIHFGKSGESLLFYAWKRDLLLCSNGAFEVVVKCLGLQLAL